VCHRLATFPLLRRGVVKTRVQTAAIIGSALALVAPMLAAGVWDTKPYNMWTDRELKEVLTDSPWAGKGAITYIRTQGATSPAIEEVALVSWASALPMRQGAVREQVAVGTTLSAEVESALARPLEVYGIAVRVSGGMGSSGYARNVAAMQAETFLMREGKPPIRAFNSEGRMLDKDGKVVEMPAPPPAGSGAPGQGGGAATPGGQPRGFGGGGGGGGRPANRDGSSLLLFAFPKSDAITLADKEVEFVTKLCAPSFGPAAPGQACQYNVRKKFKLKDMVLKGELAL
jgi:hypothetical protein